MDSLSYLIENNNDVIIDQGLLHDLELKSQQKLPMSPSIQSKNQPQKYTKKYSPMNRPVRRSPQGHKVLKTQTTKMDQQVEGHLFNEEESIQLLTTKIESLKEGQRHMEEKYGEIIRNLRNELNKRNSQYQHQCEEFNHIKNELNTTKKDIASLIGLLKQNTNRATESSKRVQSPTVGKGKGAMLGGFCKSSKDII